MTVISYQDRDVERYVHEYNYRSSPQTENLQSREDIRVHFIHRLIHCSDPAARCSRMWLRATCKKVNGLTLRC